MQRMDVHSITRPLQDLIEIEEEAEREVRLNAVFPSYSRYFQAARLLAKRQAEVELNSKVQV